MQAKESLAADQPPEVRILKHLLTVEGEQDLAAGVEQAFASGPAPPGAAGTDFLSTCATTHNSWLQALFGDEPRSSSVIRCEFGWCSRRTPEALLETINTVLSTYDNQLGGAGLMAESAALMNPEVIRKLRDLQQRIRKGYM